MESSLEMWLWLLLVMQPHNPRTYKILDACGYDIRSACVGVRDGAFPFLTNNEKKRAVDTRMKEIRDLQRLCGENNISIVPIDSPDYPEKLRLISNPPIVLFVQGNIRCLKNRLIISAVGTRRPSEYSVRVAGLLAGQLAAAGAAVVSGLAVGLDTAAHRGALNANGITVGVLACGSLFDYPTESSELKKEIVRKGGALIGELMPNSSCPNGYFPMRNRIMAGIADATVVLEAAARSGTLLTANHAFDMRRRVFVIPPNDIFDARYAGLTGLYRNGATPVFGVEDILNAFMPTRADNVGTAARGASPEPMAEPSRQARNSKPVQSSRNAKPVKRGSNNTKPVKPTQNAQPVQPQNEPRQSGKYFIPKPPTEEELKRNSPEGKLAVKFFSSTDRYVSFPEDYLNENGGKTARIGKRKKQFRTPPQMLPGLDYSILVLLADRDMTIEEIMNFYKTKHTYEQLSDALINLEMEGYVAKNPNGSYMRL